ncbi:MAG: RnfABCDGE type electron transport complex subunit B, partial [Tissierellales bacterium]|nr:RnfABCDGE type electron transport complex subunit B [Tissierellales bacterium]
MNSIFNAILTLGGLGLAFGILLAVASKVFHVEVDPKITQIKDALPGANCGACGYPGCDALAKAIAEGKVPANSCPVGGAETTAKVSEILGVEAGDDSGGKKVARVLCAGCDSISKKKF